MPYARNSDLPAQIKRVLPEEAQTVFRKAFNAARSRNETLSESRIFAIAWGAVRRLWHAPEGEASIWVKKRSNDSVEVFETVTMDAASDVRRTSDGYLVATPRVARTGIQIYKGSDLGRDDMPEVRVYRPESEVFSKDTLRSFAHRPVTIDHPTDLVTSDNWRHLAVGQTGDEVVRDGQFIRVPMSLMDAEAIRQVEGGKAELSMGYTMELIWDGGETEDGEAYDAVQTKIRGNHLAVVDAARGGPQLRIGDGSSGSQWTDDQIIRMAADIADMMSSDEGEGTMTTKRMVIDGITVEVSDMAEEVIKRKIKEAEDEIASLKSQLEKSGGEASDSKTKLEKAEADAKTAADAATAEIATLKTQLTDAEMTPAKLDTLVKDRAETIAKARAVVSTVKVDGVTDTDIRRQVVDSKLGDAAKDWSDDQVSASFNTLTAGANTRDALADAIRHSPGGVTDARDEAYEAHDKAIGDAWKTKAA